MAKQHHERREKHDPRGNSFSDEVAGHLGFPGGYVGRGVCRPSYQICFICRRRRMVRSDVSPNKPVAANSRPQRI